MFPGTTTRRRRRASAPTEKKTTCPRSFRTQLPCHPVVSGCPEPEPRDERRRPHRAALTALVGLTAAAVVAGVVALSPTIERLMPRLPAMPTTAIAFGFAAVGLLVFAVWAVAQLSRAVRTRARRTALAATVRGELSCGIRNRTARPAPERGRERRSAGAARRPILDRRRRARRRVLERREPADAGPPSSRGARCATSAPTRWCVGGTVVPVVELRVRHSGVERRAAHHPVVGSPRAIRAGRCAVLRGGAQLEGEAPHRARRRGPRAAAPHRADPDHHATLAPPPPLTRG